MLLSEILEQLHTEMAKNLLERVISGEASAAELSVARQFLKDNGVDTDPAQSKPIGDLAKTLPQFDQNDGVVPFTRR